MVDAPAADEKIAGPDHRPIDDEQHGTGGSLATVVTRSVLLVLALLGLALLPVDAAHAKAKAPKQSSFIIDANTGKVLHDDDGDEPRFPASLTKMMTLYILFGEIEQGRLSYASKIRISERAHGMAPSKLGLEPGEEISVIDAIRALVVKSANDIAVAVAEHIGGSEYQFARLMTERAHQIGMTSTTFRNASGLPNPGQLSTARDMVTLALRLHDDYPQHYRHFSLASFTFGGKEYKSHNTLMRGFPGMDGIKTGYTRLSGFNLVSSVRADGKHVVGAVFGGKTAATRNALMRSLLYTALGQASTTKTRKPQTPLIATRRPPKLVAPPVEMAAADPKPVARAAATANVPLPVRAVRPARKPTREPARDQIAQVLSTTTPAPVAQLPSGNAPAEVAPPPRLDLDALRAAMSEEADQTEQAEAELAEPPPMRTAQAGAASAQDIAGLIRNSIVDGAPARAPSTLNAQANALGAREVAQTVSEEGSAGPVALATAARAPAAHAAPTGSLGAGSRGAGALGAGTLGGKGFEIQIGAYTTPAEAQSKIDLVRQRAVALLEGHSGITMPVQQADRQIFRARFVNFDETSAASTCLELRRLAIDCLVMRAD